MRASASVEPPGDPVAAAASKYRASVTSNSMDALYSTAPVSEENDEYQQQNDGYYEHEAYADDHGEAQAASASRATPSALASPPAAEPSTLTDLDAAYHRRRGIRSRTAAAVSRSTSATLTALHLVHGHSATQSDQSTPYTYRSASAAAAVVTPDKEDFAHTEVSQSPSWLSSTSSVASSRVPADVRVVVGTLQKREFAHSSHMLRYASPVLNALLSNPNVSTHVLEFPHHAPHEWKCLKKFLEPHAVQAAVVTADELPVLLPWFCELQLALLIKDCDSILASLSWPISSQAVVTDLQDALLAVRIAVFDDGKSLPQTFAACTAVISSYLTNRPDLWLLHKSSVVVTQPGSTKSAPRGGHRLDTSLAVMMELGDILQHPAARDAIWRSVCMYLPPDLPVYSDQAALTANPLFGYLLRQGLEMAWAEASSPVSSPSRPPKPVNAPISCSHTPSSKSPTDWQRDFSTWWENWNQASSESSEDGSKDKQNRDKNRGGSKKSPRQSSTSSSNGSPRRPSSTRGTGGGLAPTVDRTAWLEEILRKLQDAVPAILDAQVLVRRGIPATAVQPPVQQLQRLAVHEPFGRPGDADEMQTSPYGMVSETYEAQPIPYETAQAPSQSMTYETTAALQSSGTRPGRRTFAC